MAEADAVKRQSKVESHQNSVPAADSWQKAKCILLWHQICGLSGQRKRTSRAKSSQQKFITAPIDKKDEKNHMCYGTAGSFSV